MKKYTEQEKSNIEASKRAFPEIPLIDFGESRDEIIKVLQKNLKHKLNEEEYDALNTTLKSIYKYDITTDTCNLIGTKSLG